MEAIELMSANEKEIDAYLRRREKECIRNIHNENDKYTIIDQYVDKVIQHFSLHSIADLRAYEEKLITKDEFLEKIRSEINRYELTRNEKDEVFEGYQKFMWSYDVIDTLITDPYISDIKLIDPYRVIVKRKGKREISNIKFRGSEHYRKFIARIAVRNQINLSSKNAIQSFVDVTSSDLFRLRFNVSTDLINANGFPSLHIRKIPKYKYTIQDLINMGMATKNQFAYLIRAIEVGKSIICCGQGGSGKTTLMNLMLDYIPHDNSILCIQDNDELFSKYHPDIMCQNTVANKDSDVSYELKDLAKNGLLLDIDWFVIGEIKGEEARYLFDAACTGAHCMASLHTSNGEEALIRLADLVKRASDYNQKDILRILSTHFNNIVYLDKFQIKEILEIEGWDNDKEKVIYKRIGEEEK